MAKVAESPEHSHQCLQSFTSLSGELASEAVLQRAALTGEVQLGLVLATKVRVAAQPIFEHPLQSRAELSSQLAAVVPAVPSVVPVVLAEGFKA